MNINTMARLTLIGLVYIYATKLIDTLYHGLFRPAAFAGVIVGLNILAGIAQFVFLQPFTNMWYGLLIFVTII